MAYIIMLVCYFLLSSAAMAEPVVAGNIISWPDDGWYQVQNERDYSQVCAGGSKCTVESGRYVVINHTTGQRYSGVEVNYSRGSETSLIVTDTTISWPDDGWYQVQDERDYSEVCSGGRSCTVEAGRYIVINHTTGQRHVGVTVGSPGDSTFLVTVTGNTIHWQNDGWYQVQDEKDYSEVCYGGDSCLVEPGSYIVINHTTGERLTGVKVGAQDAPVGPSANVTLLSSIGATGEALVSEGADLQWFGGDGSIVNALSDDGRYAYFYTREPVVPGMTEVWETEQLIRFDAWEGKNALMSTTFRPEYYFMESDGKSGFYYDESVSLRYYNEQLGSIVLKDLVQGANSIRGAKVSRDQSSIAFVSVHNGPQSSQEYGAHIYKFDSQTLHTIAKEFTPSKDASERRIDWKITTVHSISDNGDVVVFGGHYSPLPIEFEFSYNVASHATIVFDAVADTVDIVGQYVFDSQNSSTEFDQQFAPLVSADGRRVIYNVLPESRWGELGPLQGYMYDVETGLSTVLTGLSGGGSAASISSDLSRLVYRRGNNIELYYTDTLERRQLSSLAWDYCSWPCQIDQNNSVMPGISGDGSTVLFFESMPLDGDDYPASDARQLMIHDVDKNTTMALSTALGGFSEKMPFVSLNGFNLFDISEDGKNILVSALRDDPRDSHPGVYNVYMITRR